MLGIQPYGGNVLNRKSRRNLSVSFGDTSLPKYIQDMNDCPDYATEMIAVMTGRWSADISHY